MDRNHKVRLPIFSIHGNHDCPSGLELQGALDQVCTNKYVNYFGKVDNIEEVAVEPILFAKGATKIALYGIGHIKDLRLNLLFENNKITFNQPKLANGQIDSNYFSILVLHQNRFKGVSGWSTRDSITDEIIPSWFDLVVWGHEHECLGMRTLSLGESVLKILQPGSTVITSLIEGEQTPKKAWILTVSPELFNIDPV